MIIERNHIRQWVLGLILLSPFTFHLSPSYAQDYARLSERTIMGTARYVGMGGAMTAVGGDPSAVLDNVAGLGLYRRPEVMITFDYVPRSIFMAPQASAIFTFQTGQNQGVICHNFMIGYHRVHCFNQSMQATSGKGASLGSLIATTPAYLGIDYTSDRYHAADSLSVYERGYVNEYSFDWAMNISNRWYWGLGLRVQSFLMSSDGDYYEVFDKQNADLQPYFNRSRTSLMFSGAGCSFATGLIYRPSQWVRIGFGLETPSLGNMTISSTGRFDARTDSLRRGNDAPPLRDETSSFHMPLRLSASVAFQVLDYALLAFQYDYRHVQRSYDVHSLRAGLELTPYNGVYINAGYVFESPFKKHIAAYLIDSAWERRDAYYQYPRYQQYISGAVGYRGNYMIIQAAYQYRMNRYKLYAHQNAEPYYMAQDTHRIVLTLAWHGRN